MKNWAITGLFGSGVLAGAVACLVPESRGNYCEGYCERITSDCSADTRVQFRDIGVCRSVCEQWETGSSPRGNTFACRNSIRPLGEVTSCRVAGPGGYGQCGTACEAYCELRANNCDREDEPNCVLQCNALMRPQSASVDRGLGNTLEGDSLECRIQLLSQATLSSVSDQGRAVLCNQSQIHVYRFVPQSEQDLSPCRSEIGCEDYCQLFDSVCGDEPGDVPFRATEGMSSQEVCVSACAGFNGGSTPAYPAEETGNTAQCRYYHLLNAIIGLDPNNVQEKALHCRHASLSGGGICQ